MTVKGCVEPDCDRPHYARGLCNMHWQQWRQTALKRDIQLSGFTYMERFWAKVDKNGPIPENRPDLGPCWEWTGANTAGYGVYGRGPQKLVHRMSYELHIGPIPAGLQIDHLCRNRCCLNPDHLEVVTGAENLRRSLGPTGLNAQKTHCKRGHPFDEGNTRIGKDGSRNCRTCVREAVYRSRDKYQRPVQKNY